MLFPQSICGSAAAHSGKALPFRSSSFLCSLGYASAVGGAASRENIGDCTGKPKAYRYVLRQSRVAVTVELIVTRIEARSLSLPVLTSLPQ
jgi:hypothetical protein